MKRRNPIIYITVLTLLLTLVSNTHVEAVDAGGRLRDCLENDHLYFSTGVTVLNNMISRNKTGFKERYDGQYVVLTGLITSASVSDNYKEVYIYSDGQSALVDTSDEAMKDIAKKLSVGDMLTVYGKVDVRGMDVKKVTDGQLITSKDISDHNTFDKPDEIDLQSFSKYSIKNGIITVELPAKSVVTFAVK